MLISNTGGISYKLTHAALKGCTAKTKVPLLQNAHPKNNWNATTNPSTMHFYKHMCSAYEHIYIYICQAGSGLNVWEMEPYIIWGVSIYDSNWRTNILWW